MPVVCGVCQHPRVVQIDEELSVSGVNLTKLAANFDLHRKAVARHRDLHVEKMTTIGNVSIVQQIRPLLEAIRDGQDELLTMVRRAEKQGKDSFALSVRSEWRRGLELQAKLEGLLSDAAKVQVENLFASNEFQAHVQNVLDAVEGEFGAEGRLKIAHLLAMGEG